MFYCKELTLLNHYYDGPFDVFLLCNKRTTNTFFSLSVLFHAVTGFGPLNLRSWACCSTKCSKAARYIDVTLLKWEQFFTEYIYSMMLDTNMDVIFIWNGKKGKESKTPERSRERERERESVCVCMREGGWQQEEVVSVVKTTVEENGPFG
jgi:hypothetical protein